MLPAAPWDERTKFVAETVRAIVLGVIGAIAVLLFIKPWEKDIEYQAEITKTRLTVSAKVVDDFLAAAYLYTSTAADACNREVEALKLFQGAAFDQFRAAENRLAIYFADFPAVRDHVAIVQKKTGDLFAVCKAGGAKAQWEPLRSALKASNNDLARQALLALGFDRSKQ